MPPILPIQPLYSLTNSYTPRSDQDVLPNLTSINPLFFFIFNTAINIVYTGIALLVNCAQKCAFRVACVEETGQVWGRTPPILGNIWACTFLPKSNILSIESMLGEKVHQVVREVHFGHSPVQALILAFDLARSQYLAGCLYEYVSSQCTLCSMPVSTSTCQHAQWAH